MLLLLLRLCLWHWLARGINRLLICSLRTMVLLRPRWSNLTRLRLR